MSDRPNPFVLGKPIKEPEDFLGRERELRELFESVVSMQPVALVGEHRCGNTSLLYQMLHEAVHARYFDEGEGDGLIFGFVNAQMAADSPEAFYRRIARACRRADPDAAVDFEVPIDAFWIEDYLEDVAGRGHRLVLLMDEFEVLAGFQASFWEWFRGLIIEYDLSIVVATRVELGEFRDEWGSGSPFFNMFRNIYVGSFTRAETDAFIEHASACTGLDYASVRDTILDLGGRFPYYLQVAASSFFDGAAREGGPAFGSPGHIAAAVHEFRARTEPHFDDIWPKLPPGERDALSWLAVGEVPAARDAVVVNMAQPSLVRRGYVVEGQIFSTAFADYVRRHIPRIELQPDTGLVRVAKRPVELPPKEFALLRFLFEKEGDVVTKDDIAGAVWPEYRADSIGVTDAMIQKTISRLRKEVDVESDSFQHIESVRGQGYRFRNASVYQVVEQERSEGNALPAGAAATT